MIIYDFRLHKISPLHTLENVMVTWHAIKNMSLLILLWASWFPLTIAVQHPLTFIFCHFKVMFWSGPLNVSYAKRRAFKKLCCVTCLKSGTDPAVPSCYSFLQLASLLINCNELEAGYNAPFRLSIGSVHLGLDCWCWGSEERSLRRVLDNARKKLNSVTAC